MSHRAFTTLIARRRAAILAALERGQITITLATALLAILDRSAVAESHIATTES